MSDPSLGVTHFGAKMIKKLAKMREVRDPSLEVTQKWWKNQWETKGFETQPNPGADLRAPRFGQEGVRNEGLQNGQPRCSRKVTPIPPPVDPRLRPRIPT